jgi:hypothetical protein
LVFPPITLIAQSDVKLNSVARRRADIERSAKGKLL